MMEGMDSGAVFDGLSMMEGTEPNRNKVAMIDGLEEARARMRKKKTARVLRNEVLWNLAGLDSTQPDHVYALEKVKEAKEKPDFSEVEEDCKYYTDVIERHGGLYSWSSVASMFAEETDARGLFIAAVLWKDKVKMEQSAKLGFSYAESSIEKSAALGNPLALMYVGMEALSGPREEIDDERVQTAIRAFEKASEAGWKPAMRELAGVLGKFSRDEASMDYERQYDLLGRSEMLCEEEISSFLEAMYLQWKHEIPTNLNKVYGKSFFYF
jgi:hypothetical protein